MTQKLWNAAVAGVDVCDSVVLRVEGVCGSEQVFHDETLEHSLSLDTMCDRRGTTNVRAVRS